MVRCLHLNIYSICITALTFTQIPLVQAALFLCASKNTSPGTETVNTYQSNGACTTTCTGYAYAILLGSQCWCSNIQPGTDTIVSTSNCSDSCPGYPEDKCGNIADGYYGYILLGTPSSTMSVSKAQSSASVSSKVSLSTTSSSRSSKTSSSSTSSSTKLSSSTSSSSSLPSTVSSTESPVLTSSSSQNPSTQSSTQSSRQSSKSSSITKASTSSSPNVITSVVTVTGQVQIFTVTQLRSTPSSSSPSAVGESSQAKSSSVLASEGSNSSSSSSSFWDSKGKVAGTFTAVGVVVFALLAGLIYWFFFAKRRNGDDDDDDDDEEVIRNPHAAPGAFSDFFNPRISQDSPILPIVNPSGGGGGGLNNETRLPSMNQYGNSMGGSSPAIAAAGGAGAAVLSNSGSSSRSTPPISTSQVANNNNNSPSPHTLTSYDAGILGPTILHEDDVGGTIFTSPHPDAAPRHNSFSLGSINPLHKHSRSNSQSFSDMVADAIDAKSDIGDMPLVGQYPGYSRQQHSEPIKAGISEGEIGRGGYDPYPVGFEGIGGIQSILPVDQRLDPSKLALRFGADPNGSRHSFQDDYDYSRKILRVTNG